MSSKLVPSTGRVQEVKWQRLQLKDGKQKDELIRNLLQFVCNVVKSFSVVKKKTTHMPDGICFFYPLH